MEHKKVYIILKIEKSSIYPNEELICIDCYTSLEKGELAPLVNHWKRRIREDSKIVGKYRVFSVQYDISDHLWWSNDFMTRLDIKQILALKKYREL